MKFREKVYKIVEKIPKGKVMTYKQVAERLRSKAYRAVGQALRNNPDTLKTPCHRVIKSNGNIGGYFGKIDQKSIKNKIKLLESEGVMIEKGKIKNFGEFLFNIH